MELRFDYLPDRMFYAVRFRPGAYESTPFIRELRFWGVDRVPCPSLSTMAALLALKGHPMSVVTLQDAALSPAVCTALSQYFGVAVHPASLEVDRRDLPGGERTVAPVRFASASGMTGGLDGAEVVTWTSLDDLRGPFGGAIRTNLDAFDLDETEKNLIVALCCAGKDVGHILLPDAAPGLTAVFHRIGLEIVDRSPAD
ncbi:hypothetical protein HKCCE3408_14480 [Rhodobacterales bacterium HKCCE3408]|nr:hypothetical protein [Rhodobacterales bacterium HKCCE3408]